MSTAVYRGPLVASPQAAGMVQLAPEVNDLTGDRDDNAVELSGLTGQDEGFGSHRGQAAPNLSVTRLSNPVTVRTEPANTAVNQNRLTAARPRGQR